MPTTRCHIDCDRKFTLDKNERPRCGRRTSNGAPCAQVLRYSAPLGCYAAACRRHLTDAERAAEAAEPYWTMEAQILWALTNGGDGGLVVREIANRLRHQTSPVTATLHELDDRGEVVQWTDDRRDKWRTSEQYTAWQQHTQRAAERAATAEWLRQLRATRLAEARNGLREALIDHPTIGVSSLHDLFPNAQGSDQIMITTDDPEAAEWLLARLQPEPTDRLEEILSPLTWAGWQIDDLQQEHDDETGPHVYGQLSRTDVTITFEYDQQPGALRLLPFEDVTGDTPELILSTV